MKLMKKDFFWTSLYNGIIGTFNAILLLVCVRINGVLMSGQFIIILTTVTMLSLIGEYGLRIFQVTDVERKFSFKEYLFTKNILLLATIIFSFIYVIFKQYNLYDFLIFSCLTGLKLIDNMSDTLQAELQLRHNLAQASKYAFLRMLIYTLVFTLVDLKTHNLVLAAFGAFIINTILFIVFDLLILKVLQYITSKFKIDHVKELIKHCFPIFLMSILNMYIINSVKYILDHKQMYELQTYYNVIYITMFILNLLAVFIIEPMLEPLAKIYGKKDLNKFKKYIFRIIMILIICALLLVIFLFFFGPTLIKLVYGIDISIYKSELCIMVIGALFYATYTIFQNILTIMRKQKKLLFISILISIICLICSYVFNSINMTYIVILNNIIMFLLLTFTSIVFFKEIFKHTYMN